MREVSVPPRAAIWVLLWLRGQAGTRLTSPGALGWGRFTLHRRAVQALRIPVLCLLPLLAFSHRTRPPPDARGTGHSRQGLLLLQPRARAAAFPSPGACAVGRGELQVEPLSA